MLHSLRFHFGIVSLLVFLPAIAVAQAPPTVTSPGSNTPPPSGQESRPSLPGIERPSQSTPQETPQSLPITCPAGQFPSKFSDVTPNDWAYEAVNRITTGEFRCFPLPSPRS